MPPTKYCGKRVPLPEGYQRYGTRYECLQAGFGVATALCHQNLHPRRKYAVVSWTLVILLIVVITISMSVLAYVVIRLFRRKESLPDDPDDDVMIQKIDWS